MNRNKGEKTVQLINHDYFRSSSQQDPPYTKVYHLRTDLLQRFFHLLSQLTKLLLNLVRQKVGYYEVLLIMH